MPDASLPFQRATFLRGVARLSQLPADHGAEVAFAGRSNVGKSSAINAITGLNGLARTSKTPGRTQQINFFDMGNERRLVDLPGYGFARAPDRVRQQWAALVEAYLNSRGSLRGVILLMDVRRPLMALDSQLVAWCRHARVPCHFLLTKADKLSRARATAALHDTRKRLGFRDEGAPLALFSATQRTGIDQARQALARWLLAHGSNTQPE